MARRGSSRQRDTTAIATPVLPSLHVSTNLSLVRALAAARAHQTAKLRALAQSSDLRRFHPQKLAVRPVAVVRKRSSRRVINTRQDQFKWYRPKDIPICIRRAMRRQVMFALKLRGKGSRSRFRVRNIFSSMSCRG